MFLNFIMSIKFTLLFSFFFFIAVSNAQSSDEESGLPKFTFSWLDDKNNFTSGEVASVIITVFGNVENTSAFKPTLTVNNKIGNSSYISGVSLDVTTWKISFVPIMIGIFNLVIDEKNFKVLDSSLHFQLQPGLMYPSVSVVSWMGLTSVFEAGMNASILILPKDAFGNNVTFSGNETEFQGFSLSLFNENGSIADTTLNISHIRWIESGYISIEFVLITSGNFSLLVEKDSQTMNGIPLPLEVNSGPLDVSNCVSIWKSEQNTWQLFSKMEILLHQKDRFGNLVSGFYEFDADVVEKDTGLSIPVADFQFEYVEPGIQLMSFTLSEPGNFLLTLSDMKHNKSISGMPYEYTVYIGYCDGSRSIVNGSGINASIAGESLSFSVYLKDAYGYPSSIQADRFQLLNDKLTGTGQSYHPLFEKLGGKAASKTLVTHTSSFDVIYTPKKSGMYRIFISAGNIVLNGGQPFIKEVNAGEVSLAECSVTQFKAKVPKEIKNEIVVLLLDGHYNPVPSQQSRLKLEITSANTSSFTTWEFVDNKNGTYTGSYLAMEVGTYRMCVSFDKEHIQPCPSDVNVYSSGYFPKAYDDAVNVWEDESISFNLLGNDYFGGDNASILGSSLPSHGSLLRDGNIFRYTPVKDFSGNDSFLYTMADVNENLAVATVYICILTAPPQFLSFSGGLQATEDLISPRSGGFSGLEISYSDLLENISVTVQAVSGSVILSPMLMQFRLPSSGRLSVSNGGEDGRLLILEGQIGVINPALQSIQYLGNENFAGADSLRLSTKNKNGINHLDVPVFVEPVNDPPFINVPQYIMLDSNGSESLIFHRERDKFNFSVGDPDLTNFPGGETHFLVMFSVEVSDGYLLTNLPAELINSTELKFKNIFQWQPIQTYAAISKHVNVKASGIRFLGTLQQCNDLMRQLLHQGGENGAVLTLKLNDMGNFGCFLDCTEKISLPLHAEAHVNLIRKRPLSSLAAHVIGSVIVVESLVVFSLATLLLFFTCKCAFLLVHERRTEHSVHKNSPKPTNNVRLFEDNVSKRTIRGCFRESIWNRRQPTRDIGETSGKQNKPLPETNIFPFGAREGDSFMNLKTELGLHTIKQSPGRETEMD